jgi:hypothetical protein
LPVAEEHLAMGVGGFVEGHGQGRRGNRGQPTEQQQAKEHGANLPED